MLRMRRVPDLKLRHSLPWAVRLIGLGLFNPEPEPPRIARENARHHVTIIMARILVEGRGRPAPPVAAEKKLFNEIDSLFAMHHASEVVEKGCFRQCILRRSRSIQSKFHTKHLIGRDHGATRSEQLVAKRHSIEHQPRSVRELLHENRIHPRNAHIHN